MKDRLLRKQQETELSQNSRNYQTFTDEDGDEQKNLPSEDNNTPPTSAPSPVVEVCKASVCGILSMLACIPSYLLTQAHCGGDHPTEFNDEASRVNFCATQFNRDFYELGKPGKWHSFFSAPCVTIENSVETLKNCGKSAPSRQIMS